MKLLYLLTRERDDTINTIMAAQQEHRLTCLDIREEPDYDRIIGLLEENDRVICW